MKRIKRMTLLICVFVLWGFGNKSSALEIERYDGYPSFFGDISISEYNIAILGKDGQVYVQGNNEFGQYGNGTRTENEGWNQVEGLEDIKYIFSVCPEGFGHRSGHSTQKNEEGTRMFAIDGSGVLWQWGTNILYPERVELGQKIVCIHTNNMMETSTPVFECEDGNLYTVDRFRTVIQITSLGENDKISQSGELIIRDDVISLYRYEPGAGKLEHPILEDQLKLKVEIALDELKNIQYAVLNIDRTPTIYVCLNAEEDNLYEITLDKSMTEVKYVDCIGSHIAKFDMFEDNVASPAGILKMYLTQGGTMYLGGANTFGQLGDGTTYDYYDSFLAIRDIEVTDYFANEHFIAAISEDGDVWAWGKEHSTVPEIVVSSYEFEGNL